jgi:hypothetical protein
LSTGCQWHATVKIRIEGLKGVEVANLLAHIWEKMEQELHNGAAVTVSKNRIRTRKLPLIGKKD